MKRLFIFLLLIIPFFSGIKNTLAINGIDISAWQGEIDFEKVKEDNIEIVYIRSSSGNSYIDSDFEYNYKHAKEAGLKIGFYHYLTARDEEEAVIQAEFFASVISGKEIDCRLAMDFETFAGLSKEEINAIAQAFLTRLHELTNKDLVIYSNEYNANNVFSKALFEKYPLWVAEYGVNNPGVDSWIGWQYSDEGRVNGINGNVDKDNFKEEIYLSDKTPIEEPGINKTKTFYYRVKRGNTLSEIAKKYNMPLTLLIKENNIKNPNLIYPNEILKIEVDYKYKHTITGNNITYEVKKGNTLTGIANKYGVLVPNLVIWNNIKNPNLIYPGEILKIKSINDDLLIKYTVKSGNTLSYIAKEYNTSVYELALINKIKNPNYIYVDEIIYIPEAYILED